MVWDNQYYNMDRPPQFWGASNSNWQRAKRMDPDQGSHKSRYSNESRRSTFRGTGGPPDISSQHSVQSGRSISKRSGPRRTGGPPDDSSSNLEHSIGSLVPRSRQVAKSRNLLNDRIQWDGKCSTFRPYKLHLRALIASWSWIPG